ncbi:MAG: hypothetical protein CMJ84_16035 [Planctomycetes bacterium]|nr:hypothetical protein [Planctomycetota bacterium]
MAGLGQNVGTQFSLRSRMNGSATVGGQNIATWYFAEQGTGPGTGFMGDRQIPSIHIEPIEGQLITVDFFNQSMMPHTIHLHGLDVDQANDGVPETSSTVYPMQSTTYQFTAPHAGTYHYHCHVDTVLHYPMGMHGAVIVRPPDGSIDKAWAGGPTFDEEVLWQLHTVDRSWHSLSGSGPQTARFHPDGFLLNGKEEPGSLDDPYTKVVFPLGGKAYIRMINAAFQWARVSLGGLAFDVVATDGRPLPTPITAGTWEIGPGERYDLLVHGTQTGQHIAQIDYLDDYSGAVLGSARTRVEIV